MQRTIYKLPIPDKEDASRIIDDLMSELGMVKTMPIDPGVKRYEASECVLYVFRSQITPPSSQGRYNYLIDFNFSDNAGNEYNRVLSKLKQIMPGARELE